MMRGRISSQTGETLAETLAAVLVATLAATALLMGTQAATSMNRQADERAADISAQMEQAEQHGDWLGSDAQTSDGAGSAEATSQVVIDGTSYDVRISGGDDVVSYQLQETDQ